MIMPEVHLSVVVQYLAVLDGNYYHYVCLWFLRYAHTARVPYTL